MPSGIYKRTKENSGSMFKTGTTIRLGMKHSPEARENIKKGLKTANFTKEGILRRNEALKLGRIGGEHCHFWKGGITPINHRIRNSTEYKLWREAVFKRDKYTCIWCGQVEGELNADHIKPFCDYPELRFAIDNGRTLCVSCHKKTDTYGNKKIIKYE